MSVEFGINESINYREWDPEGDWLTWSVLRRFLSYATGLNLDDVENLYHADSEVRDALPSRVDPDWDRGSFVYRAKLPLAELKTVMVAADARCRLARSIL